MKTFRDKKTKEMFVKMNENDTYLVSLYDSRVVDMTNFDLEEVETKPVKETVFRRLHMVKENFSVGCKQNWHLKDVLFVKLKDGNEVAFRVEHIENGRAYFVAIDAVGKSNMKEMNKYLDDFIDKLPEDFVESLVEMEHKVKGVTIRKSKVTLLSRGNISDTEGRCNGKDDVLFDGLQTEAERCKNLDGETHWYWIDTPSDYDVNEDSSSPYLCGSTCFVLVSYNGYIGSSYSSIVYAVVPCFSIEVESEENCVG